jgi:phosphomannomutase
VIPDDLRARLNAWLADDPDERDRAELTALARADGAGALAELTDRFAGRLEFGTAGLRGAVAAGPNRMNRAVVRTATAALADWLLSREATAAEAGVVIGCDARRRSDEFADEAARVLAGRGIRVHLLPPQQPTPLLAFAIRLLRAAAGIMITASHNPAADNGYKLYLGDGAQIVPPADAEIESAMSALGPLSLIPLAAPDSPLILRHGDEIAAAYLGAICARSPAPPGGEWLRFVYTPLHGVAGGLALRAFEQAGFSLPDVVTSQGSPDPDFPTVSFPNPEEPGTLDLALKLARTCGADLVLANDPDGDRLAVAVPDPDATGGWRRLTGDQVGALLGSYLLGAVAPGRPEAGPTASGWPSPGDSLVVTTIVSSRLLSRIAAAARAVYAETLTGFKWIVRAGQGHPGSSFLFGYEEALGYLVGDTVRDKDGIGAALALLGLAARCRSEGRSLLDVYDTIETTHGVHLTEQVTVATSTPMAVMARLRSAAPASLGGAPVTSATDLTGGSGGLPSADVLIYELDNSRVVIRPSGTERKIKAYLEVVESVYIRTLAEAREAAAARMSSLREAVGSMLSG